MKINRTLTVVVIVSSLSLAAVPGQAGTYLTDEIEYTLGSGANSASIVIDFDVDNYFVFEYQWDEGAPTGWDAIYALFQQTPLEMDSVNYGEWGMYVEDLRYPGGVKYDYFNDGSLGWAYFLSNDNQNWAQDATVSFRTLTDGGWDAWVWTNHDMDNWWLPIRQPGQAAIPEPSTMLLLGLGCAGLRMRKK